MSNEPTRPAVVGPLEPSVVAAERERRTSEAQLLLAYANAAHWWSEAHDGELAECGDSRDGARHRMLAADADLVRAGCVFAGGPYSGPLE